MAYRRLSAREREALSVVTEAARVRAEQWRAVANGADPWDVVDELYEADGQECVAMAVMEEKAVAVMEEILEAEREAIEPPLDTHNGADEFERQAQEAYERFELPEQEGK